MTIDNVFGFISLFAFGFTFFGVGASRWKLRLSCSEQITAKFLTTEVVSPGKTVGKFEYTYAGQKKVFYALDDLSGRKKRLFKENERYTIYVNPAHPNEFRCTKKNFYLEDFILVVMGGGSLLGIIGMFWSQVVNIHL